jgi:hypothetical protein
MQRRSEALDLENAQFVIAELRMGEAALQATKDP